MEEQLPKPVLTEFKGKYIPQNHRILPAHTIVAITTLESLRYRMQQEMFEVYGYYLTRCIN